MDMPLTQHLDELRTRVTRSVTVIMIAFMILLFKAQDLINFLKTPLVNALPPGTPALHFTGPMDVMFIGMKVAFMVAVIITSPFWLREFWKFFEPGLYPQERKHILPFIWGSIVLFLAGVSFCYFVALPWTLGFLIQIGLEVGVPIITVTDYVNLLILLFAGFGLVFETPLILVLLSMIGVIDSTTLVTQRRIAIVIILIVAAILTPGPDPVSQFVMAFPLYGLFELSILIIKWLEKNRGPVTGTLLAGAIVTAILAATTLPGARDARAGGVDADAARQRPAATSFWTVGAGIASWAITTDSIHGISGQSARVSVGHSLDQGKWNLATSLDMILGPYAPVSPGNIRRIDVDFNGTGISLTGSYRFRNLTDRQGKETGNIAGSPLVLAGLSYLDTTGRSIGGSYEEDFVLTPVNPTESSTDGVTLLDNYKLRTTRVSGIFGAGWGSNWAKQRRSNSPSDLKTTVDGYTVSLWAEVPLVSTWSAEYELVTATDKIESHAVSERGSVKGYDIVLQATALLGG